MKDLTDVLEEAIQASTRLRQTLSKNKSQQVRSSDERTHIKATCLAWFNSQRPHLNSIGEDALLGNIDDLFRDLLEYSDRSTSRSRYLSNLKDLKSNIVQLRSHVLTSGVKSQLGSVEDNVDFSALISDRDMLRIIKRRWEESNACIAVDAHLAATVMLGALLEAILLARFNMVDDKSSIFKQKSVPRDRNGKPLQIKEWTLKHYIDIAHGMGWIRQSARDIGVVLRDYRNYIHPSKELSHGITLDKNDTKVFKTIFVNLAEQIIASK
ncbi:MAG TPA: hypothetical protein ENI98_00740 [Gammaproteobacteria bacterium]|nr:hypothetical protein [Gammaproteobacteria bacterium]